MGALSAEVLLERFYKRALGQWRHRNYKKAFFYLGAATHLLQDLCEPHHAHCSCGMDHHRYEIWVKSHNEVYLAFDGGIYHRHREPAGWLKDCASKSYEFIDLVKGNQNENDYRKATEILLPFTQRATAGFWLSFLDQVGAVADLKNMFYLNPPADDAVSQLAAIAGK